MAQRRPNPYAGGGGSAVARRAPPKVGMGAPKAVARPTHHLSPTTARQSAGRLRVAAIVRKSARLKKRSGERTLTLDGSPLVVKTAIKIIKLISVDTVNETFKVHLSIEQEWSAPPTETTETLEGGEDRMDADWEPEWYPSFDFEGTSADADKFESEFHSVRKDNGEEFMICRRVEIVQDIVERMDLEEFPFDIQDLTIVFELDDPINEVVLDKFDGRSLVDLSTADVALSDFSPFEEVPFMWRETKCDTLAGGQASAITINLNMQRYYDYYIYNLVTVLFLLTSGAMGAWAIDPPAPGGEGGRILFDITVLLSAFAFKFVMVGMLPQVSYMTLMDNYIFVCFAFCFGAFFFHVIQGITAQIGFEGLGSERVDKISLVVYFVGWVITNCAFPFWIRRHRHQRIAEIREEAALGDHNKKADSSFARKNLKGKKTGEGARKALALKAMQGFGVRMTPAAEVEMTTASAPLLA